jgi:hypothetical protein
MWWMFIWCSELCWFWCLWQTYCIRCQGYLMRLGNAEMIGWMKTRRFEDNWVSTATERGRGDMTWSWVNRLIQLCKGEIRELLSPLSHPKLWLAKYPQTFLYNWQTFFHPIPWVSIWTSSVIPKSDTVHTSKSWKTTSLYNAKTQKTITMGNLIFLFILLKRYFKWYCVFVF